MGRAGGKGEEEEEKKESRGRKAGEINIKRGCEGFGILFYYVR